MLQPWTSSQLLVRTPNLLVTGDRPTTTLVGVMPTMEQGTSAEAEAALATTVDAASPRAAAAAARWRLGTKESPSVRGWLRHDRGAYLDYEIGSRNRAESVNTAQNAHSMREGTDST